ncbi:MAG: efflux RND transporter permease subunit, partial [Candidatus Omnitrophota bacterium]
GVANIEVVGGRERKILVEVDQRRLQAFGIPIQQVIHILGANNLNLLQGELEGKREKLLIRTIGEYKNVDDIKNIGVSSSPQGVIIRLKDVARVEDSYLEPEGFARIDAKPVVAVYIQRETTANILDVSKNVLKEIEKIRASLGEELIIFPVSNEAEFIEKMIRVVMSSLISGALLAVIVLMIFLRSERPVFMIGITIPISVIATFAFMMLRSTLTLNMMTLFGLALGIGMLVDNTIVVLDNINVYREKGYSSRDASEKGADEMAIAIIASTITTLVIFLPVIFANEEVKLLYEGVGYTIAFSLTSSLLVALTLIPLLASRLGFSRNSWVVATLFVVACTVTAYLTRPFVLLFVYLATFIFVGVIALSDEPRYRRHLPYFFRRFKALIFFLMALFALSFVFYFLVSARFFDQNGELAFLYDRIQDFFRRHQVLTASFFFLFLMLCLLFYRSLNRIALRFRYLCVLFSVLMFSLCIYIAVFKIDKEFLQTTEENDFTVFIELPTGAKLDISDKIVTQVEGILKDIPEVKTFQSRVERWSSKIYVTLVPLDQRDKTNAGVIEELRPLVEDLEPAFIYFEEPWQVGTQEVIIDIFGDDYEILQDLAKIIYTHMSSIPGMTDAKIRHREGRPEIQVIVDKQKASFFGLEVAEVAEVVHAQMRGLVATRYHTEAKEVETIARLEEKYRKNLSDLKRLTLMTPKGEPVFLEQLASFIFDLGPSEIWRKNKARMIQVSANKGKLSLSRAVKAIEERLEQVEFPKDYYCRFGGNYDRMVENQKQMIIGLLLSLILVYLVLASLFESFSQPLMIMMSVPQAAIGVVVALKMTQTPISIGVYIAAWLLGGVVVNNAIILVDSVNRYRESGVSGMRSILRIAERRIRPILMTTTTTLMGLLPLSLYRGEGSTLLSPTAVVLFGGLSSSTALTLFIVPCTYLIFDDIGRFFKRHLFKAA